MKTAFANTPRKSRPSTPVRPKVASDSRKSRITNGKDILPGVDQRLKIARRYRDLVSALAVDQGGAAQLSEARMQLVRRFAAASVLAEQMEGRLANGEQIDIAEHAQLSSTLVRLTNHLGLDRVPRNVNSFVAGVIDGEITPPSPWPSMRSRLAQDDDVEATP